MATDLMRVFAAILLVVIEPKVITFLSWAWYDAKLEAKKWETQN